MAVYKEINVDDLQLDLDNPRIAREMAEITNPTEADASGFLMVGAAISEDGHSIGSSNLKASIKQNEGIIHPIIVNYDSKTKKYTVIEGNTRVQIYRDLKKKKAQGNWDTIPAMVHTDLSKSYVDAIRLQAHLVGPKEWDPYAKAKYLHFLFYEKNLTRPQIIEFCGGDTSSIMKLINAYSMMEEYYRPQLGTDDFDHRTFSAFVEVQNQAIIGAIRRHQFTEKDFAKWVIEGKFSPLNTIRQLHKVLDIEDAKKLFFKKGNTMKDVQEVLDRGLRPASTSLAQATREELARALLSKLKRITVVEQREMIADPLNNERIALTDLIDELETLKNELEKN